MRLCTNTLLGSCMLLASVAPVRAGKVTFNFTGSITRIDGPILGITSAAGAPISGSFSYDTSTKGSFLNGENALYGTYQESLPAGMHIQVGTVSSSSSNYVVQVEIQTSPVTVDVLRLVSQDMLSVKGGTPDPTAFLSLDFVDFGPKVFQDVSLPTSLKLSSFDQPVIGDIHGTFLVKAGGYGGYGGYGYVPVTGDVDFSINSLNKTTTTPEPATLILLGVGLAWLLSITVLGTLQVWRKRKAAA